MALPNLSIIGERQKRTKLPEEVLEDLIGNLNLGVSIEDGDTLQNSSSVIEGVNDGLIRPSDYGKIVEADNSLRQGVYPGSESISPVVTSSPSIQLNKGITQPSPIQVASTDSTASILKTQSGTSEEGADPPGDSNLAPVSFDAAPKFEGVEQTKADFIQELQKDQENIFKRATGIDNEMDALGFQPDFKPELSVPKAPGIAYKGVTPWFETEKGYNYKEADETSLFSISSDLSNADIINTIAGSGPIDIYASDAYDVRANTEVAGAVSLISGVANAAWGPNLTDIQQKMHNFVLGEAKSLVGEGLGVLDVANNLQMIKEHFMEMDPLGQARSATYITRLTGDLYRQLDGDIARGNFIGAFTNKLNEVKESINTKKGSVGEIISDPENVLKGLSNYAKYGALNPNVVNQQMGWGTNHYTLNEAGQLADPGWIKLFGKIPFVGPTMELANFWMGVSGTRDEMTQDAIDLTNAVAAGGLEVGFSEEDTWQSNSFVYSSSGVPGEGNQYINMHVDVPGAAEKFDVNLNLGKLDPNTKISEMTSLDIDKALSGPGSSTTFVGAENPEERAELVREQIILTAKGLGMFSEIVNGREQNTGITPENVTTEALNSRIAERSASNIAGFNQTINEIMGYDHISEDNLFTSNYYNGIGAMDKKVDDIFSHWAPELETQLDVDSAQMNPPQPTESAKTFQPAFKPAPVVSQSSDAPSDSADVWSSELGEIGYTESEYAGFGGDWP